MAKIKKSCSFGRPNNSKTLKKATSRTGIESKTKGLCLASHTEAITTIPTRPHIAYIH